jgi:hypothetical protein
VPWLPDGKGRICRRTAGLAALNDCIHATVRSLIGVVVDLKPLRHVDSDAVLPSRVVPGRPAGGQQGFPASPGDRTPGGSAADQRATPGCREIARLSPRAHVDVCRLAPPESAEVVGACRVERGRSLCHRAEGGRPGHERPRTTTGRSLGPRLIRGESGAARSFSLSICLPTAGDSSRDDSTGGDAHRLRSPATISAKVIRDQSDHRPVLRQRVVFVGCLLRLHRTGRLLQSLSAMHSHDLLVGWLSNLHPDAAPGVD